MTDGSRTGADSTGKLDGTHPPVIDRLQEDAILVRKKFRQFEQPAGEIDSDFQEFRRFL